ncbi:MAG: hypothetical protein M0T84_08740 [Betaproteobacteria bacterium]|nr:hypothetical protein [Betaproteobacteria bacterium]
MRAFLVVSLILPAALAHAASGGRCAGPRCGLLSDGAYSNLVIGRLVHVGTAADMRKVYRWAKTHGYWKSLPDATAPYLRDVKLVTIALPHSIANRPVSVFMQMEEYTAMPLAVGELVRYSPHDSAHEEAAKGDAAELAFFHGLTGCVAVLCQQNDPACIKRYRQGVFTKAQGKPVDLATGAVASGTGINPVSLLPVRK